MKIQDVTVFRWAHAVGIRDENGQPLDLVNNPNLLITKMNPPLSFMASLWLYMTSANGHPSMHSAIVGSWVGYGKWTGSVFGPSSRVINNECQGEEKRVGQFGNKESRRIKAFRFFTQYLGTRVLGIGEDEGSLSCQGFDINQVNQGSLKSWDWDWAQGNKCVCIPRTWSGMLRYHDPEFSHNSQMLE